MIPFRIKDRKRKTPWGKKYTSGCRRVVGGVGWRVTNGYEVFLGCLKCSEKNSCDVAERMNIQKKKTMEVHNFIRWIICYVNFITKKPAPPSPKKDEVTVNEFTLLPEATTIKCDKGWNNGFPGSGYQAIKNLKEGK